MQRPRILVTNRVHDKVIDRLASIGNVDANDAPAPWPRDEVLARAARADAMLAFMTDRVDASFITACPRLRIIACALKGFDNFDLRACEDAGIWVSIVPDLLTAPTAELAVGLAIGLARRIHEGDEAMRSALFDGWRPILYGTGLDGSTVAIIGLGAVGGAIAARLAGFGCRIIGVDPGAPVVPGVEIAPLDSALTHADYMILATPLTSTNRHMIGASALARMKQGVLLINVGRGSVVDEAAVAETLAAGHLGGYAADVFELEDFALADRPRKIDPRLLAHPRTFFTPHLGSAVDRVRRQIELRAADNIADALAGGKPRDAINAPPPLLRYGS